MPPPGEQVEKEVIMKINGIGNVKKSEILSVLTRDGRKAVEDGTLTMAEVAQMYKLEQVKKLSKIGTTSDTFRANYSRVPENLVDKLAPADIAALVDAFYDCYSAGCAHGSNL